MIKKALEYIVGLNRPEVITIDNISYTDKPLKMIEPVVMRNEETIYMNTLTSFINYVKSQVERDNIYSYEDLYIHIQSPEKILAFEKDSAIDKRKTNICKACAILPDIQYNHWYDAEEFNILLQSRFCQNETTSKLLSIVGNVKSSDVQTKADNGITQTIQTKKGVVLSEDTVLPNPVALAPFRTFVEIEQVVSPFIFRAKEASDPYSIDKAVKTVKFALFEADGGAWKITSTQRIKAYLEAAFKDTGIVILA